MIKSLMRLDICNDTRRDTIENVKIWNYLLTNYGNSLYTREVPNSFPDDLIVISPLRGEVRMIRGKDRGRSEIDVDDLRECQLAFSI
jgi:hypothetical protein